MKIQYKLNQLPPGTKAAFEKYIEEHSQSNHLLSLHDVKNPLAVWMWRVVKYKIPMTPEMAIELLAYTYGCDV